MPSLQRKPHVFANRQTAEEVGDLKGARQACITDVVRPLFADLTSMKDHRALVRGEHSRDELEQRRLAGTVGADQCMDLA